MFENNRSESRFHVSLLAAVALGLYLCSFYTYLLFHSLVEILTIAVGFTLFMLTWNTREYLQSSYLRLLGIGYAAVAVIDLIHALAFKGMNVFPGYGLNLPMQLWIAARYLQVLTLLTAPLLMERDLPNRVIIGGYATLVPVLLALVFSGHFPDCYIEGKGLTPFKVISEYVISVFLIGSLYIFSKQRKHLANKVFILISASIACTILSEILFTRYVETHEFANKVGHLGKLAAFYLLYRAILVTGLKDPFDLIFRNLKEAKEGLQKSQETLEDKVRERTSELRDSEERYSSLIHKVQTAIVLHDGMGRVLDCNPAAQELLGLSMDQRRDGFFIEPDWHFLREDGSVLPEAEYPANHVLSTKQPLKGYVVGLKRPGGDDVVWMHVNAEPERGDAGGIARVIASFVDITERKRAEVSLRRLNRELQAISSCNQTLMRAHDEQTLLDNVCRIICDEAGYRMAWVGYAENDETKTVRPVASAGFDHGYTASAALSWSKDTERGGGPGGQAIRSGQTAYVQDIESDLEMAPWHESARERDFRSCIGLPLKEAGGMSFGVLLVYSSETTPISPGEIRLLEELVGDLAFGILALRARIERNQAERRLCESERRLQLTMEATGIGIWDWDVKHDRWYASPTYYTSLGYEPKPEGDRQEWIERVHPDDLARVRDRIQDVLSRDFNEYCYEARMLHADGSYRWQQVRGFGIERDQDLRVTRMLGIRVDITDRKLAEEALREREAMYRSLVTAMAEGVMFQSVNGDIIAVNPAAGEIEGRSIEQMIGKLSEGPQWDAIHEDGTPFPGEKHPAMVTLRTGKPQSDVVMGIHRPDGRRIWISLNSQPLKADKEALPYAVVTTFRDISEQKRLKTVEHESEQKFRSLAENSSEFIFRYDRQCRIIYANRQVEMMLSGFGDSLLGRTPLELTPGGLFEGGVGELELYQATLQKIIRSGGTADVEMHVPDSSGALRTHSVRFTAERDRYGRIVGALAFGRDITEKTKLEEQLRQSQKMEAIGQLAGGVAHDFNNILTAIIGFGNLAKMKMGPGNPQGPYIDHILSASDRAAHLTQGLLAFSRKQILVPKPVDLNAIVRNVEKLLRRLIGEDIEFTTWLTPQNLIVMADAGQIEQVLMNLATNARDAMSGKGALSISTEMKCLGKDFIDAHGYGVPGNYALMTVSDTGVGMDEKTRGKIFEPFFTTKEMGKGTGLGLSMVYGIVNQHEGNISVYSEPGKGTTFRILLPLISLEVEETQAETIEVPPGGTETLLLAEDDEDVRTMTTTVLTDAGYRVITAVDGEDALDKYRLHSEDIDLLILDVIMPRMSGKEVYDAVRASRPGAKILFISGYTADVLHKRGFFDEEAQFLAKPMSPFELLKKVRLIIEGSR